MLAGVALVAVAIKLYVLWSDPLSQLRRRGVELLYYGQYRYNRFGGFDELLGDAAHAEPNERVGAVIWNKNTAPIEADLNILQSFPDIELLDISGQYISDACAEHIQCLPRLAYLCLADSTISDGAFLKLESIGSLKVVDVWGSSVSGWARMEFRRRRPDVNVISHPH